MFIYGHIYLNNFKKQFEKENEVKKFIWIHEVEAEEMKYYEFCEKFNQKPHDGYDNIDGYVVLGEDDQITFVNKEEFGLYCTEATDDNYNLFQNTIANIIADAKDEE